MHPGIFYKLKAVCTAPLARLAAHYQRGFAAWPQPLCGNRPAETEKQHLQLLLQWNDGGFFNDDFARRRAEPPPLLWFV